MNRYEDESGGEEQTEFGHRGTLAEHSSSALKFDRCAPRMCKILSEPFSGVYLVADQCDQRDAGTLSQSLSQSTAQVIPAPANSPRLTRAHVATPFLAQ